MLAPEQQVVGGPDDRPAPRPVEPIVLGATVPGTVDTAYDLFTDAFGRWWSTGAAGFDGPTAARVEFGGGAGDPVVAVDEDRHRRRWGVVVDAARPYRLAFEWHPDDDPVAATEVDVRFRPVGPTTTEVVVREAGPPLRDPARREMTRKRWDRALDFFVAEVRAAVLPAR